MSDAISSRTQDFSQLVRSKIDEIRPRLLDLSAKNPLVSLSFGSRSAGYVRVIDELPDRVFFTLSTDGSFNFRALPPLEDGPPDEQSAPFLEAFAIGLVTDAFYLEQQSKLNADAVEYPDLVRQLERDLKDRIRENLGMPKRIVRKDESLTQHARNHDINPGFDLPAPSEHIDPKHDDDHIQTLLLGPDLERKLNGLMAKGKTWQQETGLNLLRGAFGFLEWKDPKRGDNRVYYSPLVLLPTTMSRQKTAAGPLFTVEGAGEEAETNLVLREKLRREFDIELPVFGGGSLEAYFEEVSAVEQTKVAWRVRRWIVFGVFPAARMAMYEDLDTAVSDFSENSVIENLLVGSEVGKTGAIANEYEVDAPDVEVQVPYLVKKADVSQFSVLVDLVKGNNIAVEGPPGTGKSDTIVNSIAAALAKGKKVLFVAEKSAALKVVHSRLEEVGLGEFVLPLLAGKGSREEFMDSLRSRLDVVEPSPRYLQQERERYTAARDRLARYVSILSEEWNGSGRSVHSVLGAAIATQDALMSLAPTAVSEHRLPTADLKEHEISSLVESVRRLAEISSTDAAKRSYWRGTTSLDTSPFKMNSIIARTEKAAAAYRALGEACTVLGGRTGIPTFTLVDIADLAQWANRLAERNPQSLSDDDIVVAVMDSPSTISEFLDRCLIAQKKAANLGEVVNDPQMPHLAEALARIADVCKDNGIGKLDASDRLLQIEFHLSATAAAERLVTGVSAFVHRISGAGEWTVGDVRNAVRIWSETSKRVVAQRRASLIDPASIETIKGLLERAIVIRQRHTELSATVTVKNRLKASEIEGPLAAIRQAGAFSFLSGAFKQAKAFYLSISKRGTFDKNTAIADLQQLQTFLEDEETFNERAIRSGVFGPSFEGRDTDFQTFEELIRFYEAIDKALPGFEHREIRSFLKTADADLVESMPAVGDLLPETKLGAVEGFSRDSSAVLARLREVHEELSRLEAHLRPAGKVLPPSAMRSLSADVDRLRTTLVQLDSFPEAAKLGRRFAGWKTDVPAARPLVAIGVLLEEAGKSGEILRKSLQDQVFPRLVAEINAVVAAGEAASAALAEASLEAACDLKVNATHPDAFAMSAFLSEAAEDREGLETAILLSKARTDVARYGMQETVDLLQKQVPASDNLPIMVESLVRRAAAERVYGTYGSELSGYSGKQIEDIRAEFKHADDNVRKLSRKALRSELISKARPATGNSRGRVADYAEMGLLEHLAGQRRIRVPLRDITRRAGRALLELKPCWIMSPLAVAQFIPKGSIHFDICVIDEASQMPPEDAIGALYRAYQAMIVGDTKQLPPTNFFHKIYAGDDEDDENPDAVTQESVLEMANSAFRPRRMLRWHYRSRHSALIRFSNRMMYDDDLVVFPSSNEDDPSMGVFSTFTSGIYKAGLNPIEGEAVVEAALNFMKTDPNRSLGIVAMNKSQSDFINERLQYAIARDKKATDYVERWNAERGGLEEFFVKNLENVQGDERDVIFISTVYGPPAPGERIRQAFGPLNGATGKRRLNVLFSRAKEQVRTFTSMTSGDIMAEEGGNEGALMLKRWLEYSAGGLLESSTGTHGAFDSPLEQYIAQQIEAMGCTAVPQVGVVGYSIDLGLRHPEWPNGFIMGVECDGATYHSSKSARDRDRHRQEVLENLGWKIHRVWSTDWFDNPRREAERLRVAISARLAELKARATRPLSPQPIVIANTQSTASPAQPRPHEDDRQAKLTLPAPKPAPIVRPAAPKTITARLGDTVRLRYLDRNQETYQFKIVKEPSQPERGIVNQSAPLAKGVIDTEEGEEIEILLGSLIRKAVVEKISR
ncbi:DUF4011 domain-containing protein [Rhizobium leguminosarum]|uniref:DUF4011 domain-containing protein n=1 Tax=Rhizobium leguminosarum TaxID=384 RepID=UPI001C966667|nr:DUF4011 domain-containing protein [Rhizobium leguminosarum]MBY5651777.1 DUF4011 domain-containing protein [Rhizobium leguminosarum]